MPAPVASTVAAPAPVAAVPAAPAPKPAPKPAPVAATNKPVTDRAWLTAQLQELLTQRTGYPKEMLGLDVDLEADLGVDSIKRVEILAEVAQRLEGSNGESLPAGIEMEKLTALGTLRGIVDYLDSGLNPPAATNGHAKPVVAETNGHGKKPHTNGHAVHEKNGEPKIQRAVVDLVECPPESSASSLLGGGAVLFTDDGHGVATAMAGRLADLGAQTVVLRQPGEAEGEGVYAADLCDPQAVAATLARIRDEVGPIRGLIHLLPLAPLDGAAWDRRASRDTRSLYLLAQALENDLRNAAKQGHAFLLGATRMGGTFGFGDEPLPTDYSAGQGGVPGFLKCLGQEWPEVTVRAVDLDPAESPADQADHLLAEVAASEGPFEVGHRRGKRLTWAPRSADLPPTPTGNLLAPGDVVLITGGARGITAEVAVEMARRYQPTLLLVGRSPLPPEEEAEDTRGLRGPAEIKAALIARMQREGRPAAAAPVEAAYQRLLAEREVRDNLRRLREAGSALHYYPTDVRDAAAFGGLLDDLQNRYGSFAGVVHGAGVIEDRLVKSKTPESFDRVFDTKVRSAATLASKLRQDRLKFFAFFASLASRYGNKGQADYAAANEVLSKLAWRLDREWKARVVSIAWGPWSGIGMVADLEKHLVQRGLRLIGPSEGPVLLLNELEAGNKGDSEVVLAGGAEAIVHPGRRAAPASA